MILSRRTVAVLLASLTVIPACQSSASSTAPPQAPTTPAAPPVDSTSPLAASSTAAPSAVPAEAPAPSAVASAAPAEASAPTAVASAAPATTEPKAKPATKPATESAPVAHASPAPSSDYSGPDACETKNFHFAAIANACHSGGRKAAKGVMKGVVQKAKAAGTILMCTSCHQDMATFHLKANAIGDLKNWL